MMHDASTVEVPGPLGPYASGFRQELDRLGYSRWTAYALMLMMADLSRWMAAHKVGLAEFDTRCVDAFLKDRRNSGQVRRLTRRGQVPLLTFLRSVGVTAEPRRQDQPDRPGRRLEPNELLEQFGDYLSTERGLAEGTIWSYRHYASLFLSGLPARVSTDDALSGVTGESVNEFLLAACGCRSPGTAGNVVTALRAFLRFLYLQGLTPVSLSAAVPGAPGWRDSGRSRGLSDSQVAALLRSCDRETKIGRRDFAILTVLARLGLRAKEVTDLRLDDIDWRAGELLVVGKGNRRERLPVPIDVGTAIAEYCQWGALVATAARCSNSRGRPTQL